MAKMPAAQAVVEALRIEGVDTVFGLAGSCILEIMDKLYDAKDIRFIDTRHEQAATHMADGYARASGRPGVVLVTNGPGASNLVTGVALAKLAHSPVVAVTGAPMTSQDQRESYQEFDQVALFRPITKQSYRVNRPDRIPELFRYAFATALTGKPGPVHVDIPRDLLYSEVEAEFVKPAHYRPENRARGGRELIAQAAKLLAGARHPMILVGGGVIWSGASRQAVELAELLQAPIATSAMHRDAVPNDHPLFEGQLGAKGSRGAKVTAQASDVILCLGTRLAHATTFYGYDYIPKHAKLIQVEIDQKELGRNLPVEVAILGDAREVALDLLEALHGHRPDPGAARERVAAAARHRADREREWEDARKRGGTPLKPSRFLAELRRRLPRGAIVALDAGSLCSMSTDAFDYFEPRTLLTPLDFACLGFSYAAAMGAKVARPEKPCVAIAGDGGFAMNLQELETAVRVGINTVTFILNNNCWGSEKAYQRDYCDGRYIGTEIGNPPYDRVAELFGAKGFRIDQPDQAADVIEAALTADAPVLVDVILDPGELAETVRKDAMKKRVTS